jgi:dihydrofolate reductase
MRTVTYGGANTLDNYIARSDGSFDWILESGEAMAHLGDYWKTIDTILIGRKTYEVSLKHDPNGAAYPGITNYVFSKTLEPGPIKGGEITSADVVHFVRELKAKPGKGIFLMGGGELARPVLEAGLVDELNLCIQPLLLGSGVPLFHPMKRQMDLELKECKAFQNGCVMVTYRVTH